MYVYITLFTSPLFIRACEEVKINDCITLFLNVNTSVFAKFNNKSYLESNISDNKKVKEIVSISFQLYLINKLYKDNLITKNEYHKLYSSIKTIKLIDC